MDQVEKPGRFLLPLLRFASAPPELASTFATSHGSALRHTPSMTTVITILQSNIGAHLIDMTLREKGVGSQNDHIRSQFLPKASECFREASGVGKTRAGVSTSSPE